MPQDRDDAHEDEMLMARAAWLYYVGGLNQEATAKRLGITRARVNKLLQDARGAYDFVILDTPPLMPVCDAAVMSRLVDGMLVVVAAHETTRTQLGEALSLLDESKTLGLVFNGDEGARASQYDAYYRNGR